jgi:hypothetical protein
MAQAGNVAAFGSRTKKLKLCGFKIIDFSVTRSRRRHHLKSSSLTCIFPPAQLAFLLLD